MTKPSFINEQPVTPEAFFKQRLDPVSFELGNLGAHHVMIGYLPDHGAMHIVCSAPRPGKDYIEKLEKVLTILRQHIGECKKQAGHSLILPS